MSRQSIEFFLHPPSPPRPEEPCLVLPPVSSLLRDAPLSPPPPSAPSIKEYYHHHQHHHHHPPPQINEPSPPPPADLVEPLPALTLSIPSTSSAFSSPATSPYPLDTPQSSPISSPHPGLLLPPPCNTRRSRSLSNASTSSSVSAVSTFSLPASACSSRRLSDPPLYSPIDHLPHQQQEQEHHHNQQQPQAHHHHHHHHRHDAPSTSWQRPKSTSPSLPAASCPPPFVAKRKRGRPPNASRQVSQRDCWTFVTPTVWEVKQHQQHMTDKDNGSDSDSSSFYNHTASASSPSSTSSANTSDSNMTVLLWPEEPRRNKGLNTFTSTRMDNTLSIPKKKRGRKPKVQLAGNSCFVWRDLTARRGANRKHRATTSATSSTATTTAATATPTTADEDRLARRVESIKLNSTTATISPC